MIQKLLNDVVLDHKNPFKLYKLAREYDRLEQGAAAATFYMRAAENNNEESFEEKFIQYKSLILMALVYHREGNRDITVRSILRHAITAMPNMPHAYYILSEWLADRHEWQEAYMLSKQALDCVNDFDKIDSDLVYEGKWHLEFVHAISKWKVEGSDRAKNYIFDFKYRTNHSKEYDKIIDNWIKQAGYPSTISYTDEYLEDYKYPFSGIERIRTNYSRHFQDMFVLSALNGKEEGTFIEIGSGDPYKFNNTALLEDTFGWTGINIDNDERFCHQHSRKRKTQILNADASQLDYELLFKMNCVERHVDFLRFNAEGASLAALQKVPWNRHEFFIIQFQHNECWWGPEMKKASRNILSSLGYILAVPDVSINEKDNYEDWWLHPEIAKREKRLLSKNNKNFAYTYMMKGERR